MMRPQVYGDPNGKHLCFWFHGTPSCRLEGYGLSEKVLKQLSIKVRGDDSLRQVAAGWGWIPSAVSTECSAIA